MARPHRIEFPGALYHITASSNARLDIYLTDDDREQFLEILQRVNDRHQWQGTKEDETILQDFITRK